MNKTPVILRIGFFLIGKGFDFDMWATPEPQGINPGIQDTAQPPSQIAWIPTASRLPELYKEVIIYTQDKETLHGWARVNDWDYIHSKDNRTINNVSHWMDIGSPNTEMTPGKQDTGNPTSQIANKPKLPR